MQFSSQGACEVHPRAAAIFAKLGRYARFWFGLSRLRTTTPARIATATSTGSVKTQAILKAAIKERQAGKPAEEVYKTYQGQVRPNNALAMAIASVADPERKRRYAVLNYVLVALSKMFSNLSPGLMVGAVVLGLIVPLYFAYAIARFDDARSVVRCQAPQETESKASAFFGSQR